MRNRKHKYHKKYNYNEYLINHSFIKKYYEIYIKKTIFEKIIDFLVLLAMIFTLMSFILDYILGIENQILIIIRSISFLILIIFIIELLKNYAISKKKRDFLKKNWIDIILVSFLSIYFIFFTFLSILQFFFLDYLKPLIQDLKNTRVTYKLFKETYKK